MGEQRRFQRGHKGKHQPPKHLQPPGTGGAGPDQPALPTGQVPYQAQQQRRKPVRPADAKPAGKGKFIPRKFTGAKPAGESPTSGTGKFVPRKFTPGKPADGKFTPRKFQPQPPAGKFGLRKFKDGKPVPPAADAARPASGGAGGRPPRRFAARSGPFTPQTARAAAPEQTHWDEVADWYDQLVGDTGSEYHREVVFPNLLRLLNVKSGDYLLDLACGQGAFCRLAHTRHLNVTGVDASSELIELARQRSDPAIGFVTADARALPLNDAPVTLDETALPAPLIRPNHYDHVTCILAIQDMDPLAGVMQSAWAALRPHGRLALVMMHPCFRVPKASAWGWDEPAGVQYRRVDRYLSNAQERIATHPGSAPEQHTWSFHRPLGVYIRALVATGFMIDGMEEWTSHKISDSGPRKHAENLARQEIPLFLALRALKPARL